MSRFTCLALRISAGTGSLKPGAVPNGGGSRRGHDRTPRSALRQRADAPKQQRPADRRVRRVGPVRWPKNPYREDRRGGPVARRAGRGGARGARDSRQDQGTDQESGQDCQHEGEQPQAGDPPGGRVAGPPGLSQPVLVALIVFDSGVDNPAGCDAAEDEQHDAEDGDEDEDAGDPEPIVIPEVLEDGPGWSVVTAGRSGPAVV